MQQDWYRWTHVQGTWAWRRAVQVARWAAVGAMVTVALLCLGGAPVTLGLSLIVGVPMLLAAWWLVRNDPADQPAITRSQAVALVAGVAFVGYLLLVMALDRTIVFTEQPG